jgi:hypothetical protein
MKKWLVSIALILVATQIQAQDVSDDCLQSMQRVYKFYYHEIIPKGNENNPEKLDPESLTQMEMVVGKLKSDCPAEIIAKMNQYLQAESA